MGCTASRLDKKENLQICKERRRLMQQLVVIRGEFAEAQLSYLRSLRNTGVALRQFTESDSLEPEDTSYSVPLHPSPPPPLPPAPPPPPPFLSPDLRNVDKKGKRILEDESIEMGCSSSTPPPPVPNASWINWNPFEPPSPCQYQSSEITEQVEDDWEDARTEFEEDDPEEETASIFENSVPKKPQLVELCDDTSSMTSWYDKENNKEETSMVVVEWRSKRTLDSIVKDLDDYFIKASASGEKIAVLMEISKKERSQSDIFKENKSKRYNSAKVFNAFSWSWPSKSPQLGRDSVEVRSSNQPCRPGAHCQTLEKLYAAERGLYKEMKEEEMTKLEHEKKMLLLQKLEEEDIDWTKADKTRFIVETLESNLSRLEKSISRICLSILELIDTDLYPQLVALTSGLMRMWRMMYECHHVQNDICQHLNHITDCQSLDLTSDYHRKATMQLETEVGMWYKSFRKLVKSQQAYVRTLCRWSQLTSCLKCETYTGACSSAVRSLCGQWQLALEGLPDKETSEAIESFLSAIHSVLVQQMEEHNMQRKLDKLEKKLEKDVRSLAELEQKVEGCIDADDVNSDFNPKNPLILKRAKTEALRKQVDRAKAKYENSVEFSKATTINNLKRTLPNVFHALMEFSHAYTVALESITNHVKPADSHDNNLHISSSPSTCSDRSMR